MLKHATFVALIYLPFSVKAETTPNVGELIDRWVKWSESLESLPPLKIEYESQAASDLTNGIYKQKVTAYRIGNEGYQCTHTEKTFTDQTGIGRPAFLVTLATPRHFTVLERASTSDEWRLKDSQRRSPLVSYYARMSTIPEAILDARRNGGMVGNPLLAEQDNGDLDVAFEFAPPIAYSYEGYVPVAVAKLNVTFDKESAFVPERVELYFSQGNEEKFVWSGAVAKGHVKFSGVPVPLLLEKYHSNNSDMSDFKVTSSFKILSLKQMARYDVTDRCDLAFWGLDGVTGKLQDDSTKNVVNKNQAPAFYVVGNYDKERDPVTDLATARSRAEAEGKHILLQVGGDWCGWCFRISDYMDTNEKVHELLDKHFVVMKVTYPGPHAGRFLSQFPEFDSYPHFLVLDHHGTFLRSQGTKDLQDGEDYNQEAFVDFLTSCAPRPAAEGN